MTPTKKHKGAQPANQNATQHGIYRRHVDDAELLSAIDAAGPTLGDEIALTRVLLDRITQRIHDHEHTPTNDELIQLAKAAFEGTGRMANLLRQQRILTGDNANSMEQAIATVLDELGERFSTSL